MKIISITTSLVRIALSSPYVISRGMLDAFNNVVVEIKTDEGISGFGEAVPVSLLGDPVRFKAVIEERLTPHLIGRDPADIEALVDLCLLHCDGVIAAVAGVDLALWDVLGKALKVPVSTLLGGQCQREILVDYTMSVDTPVAMAQRAREVSAAGFRGVVVKTDCKSIDIDVERVRQVRAALPPASTMRVDCNGGYSRESAFAFIERIADLGVEFVEQPVTAADLEGLKQCRGRGIRIAADEALSTPQDALRLVSAEACDVLNVKVPKAGGLLQSKRVAAIAAAANLPLVVGGGLTFGISRFASQHLAASSSQACGHCHEGPGPASQSLTDDVTSQRVTRQDVTLNGGFVIASRDAGLGFDIDRRLLAAYTV